MVWRIQECDDFSFHAAIALVSVRHPLRTGDSLGLAEARRQTHEVEKWQSTGHHGPSTRSYRGRRRFHVEPHLAKHTHQHVPRAKERDFVALQARYPLLQSQPWPEKVVSQGEKKKGKTKSNVERLKAEHAEKLAERERERWIA